MQKRVGAVLQARKDGDEVATQRALHSLHSTASKMLAVPYVRDAVIDGVLTDLAGRSITVPKYLQHNLAITGGNAMTLKAAIREFVTGQERVSLSDILTSLEGTYKANSIRQTVSNMTDDGELIRIERGVYRLNPDYVPAPPKKGSSNKPKAVAPKGITTGTASVAADSGGGLLSNPIPTGPPDWSNEAPAYEQPTEVEFVITIRGKADKLNASEVFARTLAEFGYWKLVDGVELDFYTDNPSTN